MRDDDCSSDMSAAVYFWVGFLFCLVFMIISFEVKKGVDGASLEGAARCKSLQGEYGGGKCFKDGKEV